jgi:hypothetical protein
MVEEERKRPGKDMTRSSQTAIVQEIGEVPSLGGLPWRSRVEDDLKADLMFLAEFNRDLSGNARLSRLNEKYLEQKMEELDGHSPLCIETYEYSRARLHELLLLCAANYANNCEYGPMGDLMFNPRLTLIHVRGRHEPVVKKRHTRLSEQFEDTEATPKDVVLWLKGETALETRKKPLIPHSYEMLEGCRFISKGYLDSAQGRAVQIADLSAFLCCRGFGDRLALEEWLRSASPSDRTLVESSLICLDWGIFQRLGVVVDQMVYELVGPEAKAA